MIVEQRWKKWVFFYIPLALFVLCAGLMRVPLPPGILEALRLAERPRGF